MLPYLFIKLKVNIELFDIYTAVFYNIVFSAI